MDQLEIMSKVGQVADKIRELESFKFEECNFATLVFKNNEAQAGIGITSLDLDSFNAETWQVFYPFLKQVVDEYISALGAELDSLMAKLTGEPEADAA